MLLLGLLLMPLLQSCGGSGDKCSIWNQNRQLHQALLADYLWNDEIPESINYGEYDTPSQLLDFLRKDPPDRFSYLTDAETFDALFRDGQYVGFGFSFEIAANDRLRVRFVYPGSPADWVGLERGDEILSINGIDTAELIAQNDWDAAFGPDEAGTLGTLLVRKRNGDVVEMTLKKLVIDIRTVLYSSVIEDGNDSIGYFVFTSFIDTSYEELQLLFDDFKAQGVNKLIIDLRYNGGGAIWVADALASWVYGNNQREVFAELRYNAQNQSKNYSYAMVPMPEGLAGLEQVVVITSGETCSASEMLINGLKPFVPVTTVGGSTCGKPVGMSPKRICDKMLLAVNFAVYNADGEGDYFDGIAAECPAEDDPSLPFGDGTDPMLQTALYRAVNGRCPTARRAAPLSSPVSPLKTDSLRAVVGAW